MNRRAGTSSISLLAASMLIFTLPGTTAGQALEKRQVFDDDNSSGSRGQALTVPRADGWYRWSVAASFMGARSCCYARHAGKNISQRACDLDEQRGGYTIGGDCALDSEEVRVYVRMSGGQPDRVRALNAECPVTTASEITDLGAVDAGTSVRWLAARITGDTHGNAEIIAAIPMHAGDAVFTTLTGLLEDRSQPMATREQAMFWLARSDSDEAFAYLDRLLGSR